MFPWATVFQVVGAVLFVDFFSGLVHWFEDQYGHERMPAWVVKHVVRPNRLHHIYPRKVVHCPRWISIAQGVGPAIVFFPVTIAVFGWKMGIITSCMSAIPNFVHKWNHQRDSERPGWVKALQACRIVQSPSEHHSHHAGQSDTAYCVVTPLLNPILDGIGFWRGVEWAIEKTFGLKANPPEEPHRFYRVEQGKVMEFMFDRGEWREWPDFERYQRPVG